MRANIVRTWRGSLMEARWCSESTRGLHPAPAAETSAAPGSAPGRRAVLTGCAAASARNELLAEEVHQHLHVGRGHGLRPGMVGVGVDQRVVLVDADHVDHALAVERRGHR